MKSFPVPLGFDESLEAYFDRCGLGRYDCTCSKGRNGSLSSLEHKEDCVFEQAHQRWSAGPPGRERVLAALRAASPVGC